MFVETATKCFETSDWVADFKNHFRMVSELDKKDKLGFGCRYCPWEDLKEKLQKLKEEMK